MLLGTIFFLGYAALVSFNVVAPPSRESETTLVLLAAAFCCLNRATITRIWSDK
jgi:hypothetical protein